MTEFSADAWQGSAPGLQQGLAERMDAVDKLTQGLHALAESKNITGEGADGMRAYIREVHVPVLQCLLLGLSTFQTAVGVYWVGYRQVDADGNFHLVRDEHETHVTELDAGMRQLRGIGAQLRQISADASHLVSLGHAGADAVERTVDDLQRMHLIAKTQLETWEAYEGSDPGFAQVRELISRLGGIVNRVGSVDVGRGRSYLPGSFQAELVPLGGLVAGMSQYCQDNQQRATEGWLDMFDKYAQDVEAARREQALTDLIWDGLQILAGAVVTVIGLGLTPFTGGFSLGLTVLGGSLLIGGVNNASNHASIATTGNELNLIGMASAAVVNWYDVSIAQPAAASGSWGAQFLAGVGSGAFQGVSAAAQLNVREMGEGIQALFTDQSARDQLWQQLTTTAGQLVAGDAFVIGEVASALIPGAAAAKIARMTRTTSLLRTIGQAGDINTWTLITHTSAATSALDWIKDQAGAGVKVVTQTFTRDKTLGWSPHLDSPVKPGDAHYGQPVAEHGAHRPYPPVTDANRTTFELISDPEAPWGRSPVGVPYSKHEYDVRFTDAKADPRTGNHRDIYPPNNGAVPGSRRDYHDLAAFVRDHGSALDRIGKPAGEYLGVMKGGRPASFEERSLPVNSLEKPYSSYRLADDWPPGMKGWTVEYAEIDRGFGRSGGGSQLVIRDQKGETVNVEKLLENGVLVPGGPAE